MRSASLICQPTVKQGFKDDIGSWKIIARSLPMILRRSFGLILVRSWPLNTNSSAVIFAVHGSNPIKASIDTDFPDPLSPTIAKISPTSTSWSTPSTARNAPDAVANSTVKFLIRSKLMSLAPFQFRIERVTQTIAHQVNRQNGDQDCNAGECDDPPCAQDEFTRFGQHGTPFRRWRLRAHAQKPKCSSVQNCR